MAELQLLLVAVQEVIIDDDIELDLIEEYANRHNMDNEPRWLFGPTPHVSITNYIQDTVGRYSDDLKTNRPYFFKKIWATSGLF